MCPAGSSRWCPTPEQLMILEEMYRTGVRTPNASQIQHITSHLSFYGKIEGKNVFYWFQNHKARDRQKLRRKLNKQLQFQQQLQLQQQQQQQQCYQHYQLNNPNCHQHFLWDLQSPTASSDQQLSFYNSVGSFLEEGSTGEAPKQSMNHTLRMLDNEQELMEKRTTMRALYNEDWKMMVEVGPTPCCPNYNTVATKTLELFPITSRLKEECSSSTATSTSYNKPLISETQSHGCLSLSLSAHAANNCMGRG